MPEKVSHLAVIRILTVNICQHHWFRLGDQNEIVPKKNSRSDVHKEYVIHSENGYFEKIEYP